MGSACGYSKSSRSNKTPKAFLFTISKRLQAKQAAWRESSGGGGGREQECELGRGSKGTCDMYQQPKLPPRNLQDRRANLEAWKETDTCTFEMLSFVCEARSATPTGGPDPPHQLVGPDSPHNQLVRPGPHTNWGVRSTTPAGGARSTTPTDDLDLPHQQVGHICHTNW